MQLWQIQSKTQPITPPGNEAERVSPDKWQPNTNTPQSNWHTAKLAALAAVVLAPTLAFTNLGQPERTTPDKYQPVVKEVFTLPKNQFQYPVFFYHPQPISAPETITIDKWFGETARPRFDLPRNQHLYQTYADPTYAYTLNETVKVFGSTASLITFNRTTLYQSRAFTEQALTAGEMVTVDKWGRETNRPVFTPKNHSWVTHGDLELAPTQRPELVSLDRWQQPILQPRFDVARRQWLYPPFAISAQALTQAERITPDKWQPETNKPLFDVKRQQHTYQFLAFHVKPLPVAEFLNLWHTQAPQILIPAKPLAHLYPSFTIDSKPRLESVSLDRFQQPQSLPRWDVARNQFLYPTGAIDAKLLTQPERVSYDKWNLPTNAPRFDIKRNQHLYPNFWFDHIGRVETSTLDKWFRETQQPRFDVKRTQQVYPNQFPSPQPVMAPETINADKWHPLVAQPLFDVKRAQFIYPFFVVDPKHLLDHEVTTMKWFRATEQPFFIPEQHRYIREYFAEYAIAHPWRLTDRTTDASYNDVTRSSDASYSEVSRSSDATYSEVTRSSDANYTQVNRDSDDDWNRLSREN